MIFQVLFFGYLSAFVGTLPPGLLNMTAVKIAHKNNFNRALWFSFGASLVVFIQTYLSVLFSRFLVKRTDVMEAIQDIAVFIFLILALYFFISHFVKKNSNHNTEIKLKSKKNSFFTGLMLSAFNLFPIPYYIIISITLASYGWFSFFQNYILMFALGSALAAFSVFVIYINYVNKKSYLLKHFNLTIGFITFVVAFIGLIKHFF